MRKRKRKCTCKCDTHKTKVLHHYYFVEKENPEDASSLPTTKVSSKDMETNTTSNDEDIHKLSSGSMLLQRFFDSRDSSAKRSKDVGVDVWRYDHARETTIVHKDVHSIRDLIEILDEEDGCDSSSSENYSFDIVALRKMKSSLEDLDNIIGMDNVKMQIVDQIVFFLQRLCSNLSPPRSLSPSSESILSAIMDKNVTSAPKRYSIDESIIEENAEFGSLFHTAITGPPGVGKTMLAKILAKIYLHLGLTKKNVFKIIRRSDLIGEYCGHTAVKTQRVIDDSLGGVLFIDEAYSLGSSGSRNDSFGKECIDTLNHNLTEKGSEFICIVAGYRDELQKNFFDLNPGLSRRFGFRYHIQDHSPSDLYRIFKMKFRLMKGGWTYDQEVLEPYLINNVFTDDMCKELFKGSGGDVDNLITKIKLAHSRRIFGKCISEQKKISIDDVQKAVSELRKMHDPLDDNHNENNNNSRIMSMYI